ncbi:MAG: oligosaccharide flippase family protein, partial [Pseudomonadales bacterium]|nr:oligosaccharide flippase family protein [Pseudomonadales bacterium]
MKALKQLASNVSWMMVSEGMARASRLVTLFVLASYFTNVHYGTVMLALVCHELFRILTRLGVGAKIIQCEEEQVDKLCANAILLQWGVNVFVAIVQYTTAGLLAQFYNNYDLAVLIQLMAISHLIYPLVTVKVFMLQRANRMRYYGIASGLCVAFENLFVAVGVFIYESILIVAFAKVAAALFWVVLFWQSSSKRVEPQYDANVMKGLVRDSLKIFGSEALKSFRWQADSLFAARLLSPEIFGIYSFAKSASIGIGQTLSSAYLSAVYPFLCQRRRTGNWVKELRLAYAVTALVCLGFIVQSQLAEWYIQLLFGNRWDTALLIASMLCLLAIPTLIADFVSTHLRARGDHGLDLVLMGCCSGTLALAFLIIQPASLTAIVNMQLAVGGIWCLLCALMVLDLKHYVL